MQEDAQNRRVLVLLLVAYAAATLFVTLHHEPWRDEADSWLVARDLPLSEILTWTRSIGTPVLWYAILFPLARAGAPYISQAIVHWLIAVGAAALFVLAAPFRTITKALFLFSFYPLYEYAVVARSYALGILLTFVMLALHRRRDDHVFAYAIVIALLCNVNAHSVGFAAGPMLFFFIDTVSARRREPRYWWASAMMAAGLLLAFVQLWSPGHVIPTNVISAPWYGAFPQALSLALIPSIFNGWTLAWAIACSGAIILAIRKDAAAALLLFASCSALALIFTYLWIGGYRHYGLVLIAIVAALWLASESGAKRIAVIALDLSLLASVPLAIAFIRADVTTNFSASKEMARYIGTHGLTHDDIAANRPAQCEAVLAQLPPRRFWYAALDRDGSYMLWDLAYRRAQGMRADNAAHAATAHFGDRDGLFLSDSPLPDPRQFGMTLLYATQEPLMPHIDFDPLPNDEHYWLYRYHR